MTTDAIETTTRRRVSTPGGRIPLHRLARVELRKMFDTRSGFWLLASIVITSVLANVAIIAFAPNDAVTHGTFATAIGAPMAVILPMIGILAVTGEWSQRTGLTTFTLVPHRGRVMLAKFFAALAVGIGAMILALAVGVIGNLVGAAFAGIDPVWDVSVTAFLLIVLGSVLGMLFGFMLDGMMQVVASVVIGGGLAAGPDLMLNRKVEERQTSILRALPDVLDLLTISVEAGLGFEQALDRVIAAVPGHLSDEFARMLGEARAGASRADAMRAMDERMGIPEVRAFVLAIIQADAFGVSIGRVLRAQADEMRIKRRQIAQEKAQKAPVKMLFPMVFWILPALFAVVLGPAILSIQESYK